MPRRGAWRAHRGCIRYTSRILPAQHGKQAVARVSAVDTSEFRVWRDPRFSA
jgi:hypothetical protein